MNIPRLCTAAMLLAGIATTLPAATARTEKQDESFTIAVIPDTQNYIDFSHQKNEGFAFDASAMFLKQMRYIAQNLRSNGGEIAFVDSVGDVWQHQSVAIDAAHAARGFKRGPNPLVDKFFAPTPKVRLIEMPTARQGFGMIAGKVPFSVVPGNHDYDAMWPDANHPPAANPKSAADVGVMHSSGLDNFRSVFGADTPFFKGKNWYVASHDGGADSAQIFTAGGYRFLHLGLQFDAPNASLAWAAEVIRKYPGLPTIVTMHDYLNTEGERLPNPVIDNHAVDPEDNSPQMIWDKLISQNDQIFLVICGHEHAQAFRSDENRFGHKVAQVLADYQDRHQTAEDAGIKQTPLPVGIGDGWMRLMRFQMSGITPAIHVQTYSTHYEKQSVDTAEYATWYKAEEKPKLTDAQFHAQDDFVIPLDDFRSRFGAGKR